MMPTGAVSTASDPIDPELVERFRAALDRLNPEGGRIGLAVSGGPDSMAMLLLAHAAIPGEFEVATVDHGLRPEAKDECALVVAACQDRGIPCEVLTVKVGEGNVQAEARKARYEALGSWGAGSIIATAHHADDQAETLLMRLNRGSGVAGLAGVRESYWNSDWDCVIMRPLLSFRRAELEKVASMARLAVAHDPSNEDQNYDRVRIRNALADADWLNPLAIAQSALNLADTEDALRSFSDQFWRSDVSHLGQSIQMSFPTLRVIRLRVMERAIRELGGDPRGGEVARLEKQLPKTGKANLAGVSVEFYREGDEFFLKFTPEPPRKTG